MQTSNGNPFAVVTQFDELRDHILSVLESSTSVTRKIVAIAGPPASGKSTLLSTLVPELQNSLGKEKVAGIPMDGFHLDNVQLDRTGLRAVKGAPHTFDVKGLLSLIKRLHDGEHPVYAPEFDRAGDLSRNCAIKMDEKHSVIVVEGNYLLLDQPVWREMAAHFALTIAIDVPFDVLHDRLVGRWLHYGLSENEAREKALSNDIPNAQNVVKHSIMANIIYRPETKQ